MATKIIIKRKKTMLNKVRGVKVSIDDVERGTIANGDSDEYTVEPGAHKLQCKISWYKTREQNIVIGEGETKFMQVSMGMKYFGISYIILLLAISSDFLIPRVTRMQRTDLWLWSKVIVIGVVGLYYLYYFTVGRNNYLLLEEDKDNIFN
jgi:hypothetical protein